MRDLARHLTTNAPKGGYGIEPLTRDELREWRDIMSTYRERYGFKRTW